MNIDGPKKQLLARLAGRVAPGEWIVELGAYRGDSALALAAGARPAVPIVCVDLWTLGNPDVVGDVAARKMAANGYNTLEIYKTFRRRLGARVTAVRAHSADAAALWSRPIGLLHIDADHAYEACRADFAGWSPHVTAGGVVAFDDHGPRYPGVGRVVDEVLADGWRIVEQAATLTAVTRQ